MYILFGLIALYFQIIVYEGGRYIFTKLNKVDVEEFTIGIGFKIFSRKIKGTTYNFKIIPLGGYLVFNNDEDNERAYGQKSLAVKLGLCASGIIMSIISVILLMTISSSVYGYKSNVINKVNSDNRLISVGDRIISVNNREVFTGNDAIYTMNFAGKDGVISIEDKNGSNKNLKLGDFSYKKLELNNITETNFLNSAEMGTSSTFNLIKNTYKEFYRMIIKESNLREYFSNLCEVVDQSAKGINSFMYKLLWFIIYINSTLICLNIMPLPIFDGGKIIIELINSISKNGISSRVMSNMSIGSFIAVILIIIIMII